MDHFDDIQIEELQNFDFVDDEELLNEIINEDDFNMNDYLNSNIDYWFYHVSNCERPASS